MFDYSKLSSSDWKYSEISDIELYSSSRSSPENNWRTLRAVDLRRETMFVGYDDRDENVETVAISR